MAEMVRVQQVVLPLLRGHHDMSNKMSILKSLTGVSIGTWTEDVDHREFPLVTLRRMGSTRDVTFPKKLSSQVLEIVCYSLVDQAYTEHLYDTVVEVLYEAVSAQTLTPSGYLHSISESMWSTPIVSPFNEAWCAQGVVQLGVRVLR